MQPDLQSQSGKDNNRLTPANRKIPRFRPGPNGPQTNSAEDMNRIVDAVNALYAAQIVRGSVNRFTATDSGVAYEISSGALDGSPMGMETSSGSTTPSTPLSAYWTLNEVSGVDRVDKVSGIHLPYTGGGTDSATSAAALFSNGFDLGNALQGSAFFDTSQVVSLRTTGEGFSMFGWFKILSTGTNLIQLFLNFFTATHHPAAVFGKIFVELGNTIDPIVNFQYEDSSSAHVIDTVDMSAGISTGTWYFFHLFYDPFWTGGSVGMSINAGQPTYTSNLDIVFKASGYGSFQVKVNSGSAEVLVDELGICTQRCLRDS